MLTGRREFFEWQKITGKKEKNLMKALNQSMNAVRNHGVHGLLDAHAKRGTCTRSQLKRECSCERAKTLSPPLRR
jgi:hypothetical protein